jgi:hypothetical protein
VWRFLSRCGGQAGFGKCQLLFSGFKPLVQFGIEYGLYDFPVNGAGFVSHFQQVLAADCRLNLAQASEEVRNGPFDFFLACGGHHVKEEFIFDTGEPFVKGAIFRWQFVFQRVKASFRFKAFHTDEVFVSMRYFKTVADVE